MNPDEALQLKSLEASLEPNPPGKSASRIWRIVGLVVAFQILAIVMMVVVFSAMGLANDGVGGCGGG
jgi:hypothetical protein